MYKEFYVHQPTLRVSPVETYSQRKESSGTLRFLTDWSVPANVRLGLVNGVPPQRWGHLDYCLEIQFK